VLLFLRVSTKLMSGDVTVARLGGKPHPCGRASGSITHSMCPGHDATRSGCTSQQNAHVGAYPIPRVDFSSPFIVLGANVTPNLDADREHIKKVMDKQERYFSKLQSTTLHPQILFTLLKICGTPRITYHCATTPPTATEPLATYFDDTCKRLLELIVDPTGNTPLRPDIVFAQRGAGFPHMSSHRHDLYNATKLMATSDDPAPVKMSLLLSDNNTASSPWAESQIDAQYLFFKTDGPFQSMTPAQFRAALALRLEQIPTHAQLSGTKCNCGVIYDAPLAIADHVLKCDRASAYTHTHRHDDVKDATIHCAREYGITVTKEPRTFVYDDGSKKRPDILFHTSPMKIVTDVHMLEPQACLQQGEKDKNEKHAAACAKLQCIFIPMVMHTGGTLGRKAESLITTLAKSIQPHLQQSFSRALKHAISVAAAKGRANSITSAVNRLVW